MLATILNQIIRPIIHRVGTVAGTYLATFGILSTGQIDTLSAAATIIAGLALDLVIRKAL